MKIRWSRLRKITNLELILRYIKKWWSRQFDLCTFFKVRSDEIDV